MGAAGSVCAWSSWPGALELVDAAGRVIRADKRGYIPGESPRILVRLNIDPEQFIATTAWMLKQFSTAIGTPEHPTAHCMTRKIAFSRGISAARALFERQGKRLEPYGELSPAALSPRDPKVAGSR